MNHIGNVIKELRVSRNVSRKLLAHNICSEKYVYLIEKGERTPSAEILKLFGDKLGADLFEYYQYLSCDHPIEVCDICRQITLYRGKSDFESLKLLSVVAKDLPDFKKVPWRYHLEINDIAYMIFCENRLEEANDAILALVRSMEPQYQQDVCVADLYNMLSISLQIQGDLTAAADAQRIAHDIVVPRYSKIYKYQLPVISTKISVISLYYKFGKYNEGIKESLDLLNYQYDINTYDRMHYTFFYLALCCFGLGELEGAFEYFKRMMHLLMIEYRPIDVYHMMTIEAFAQILKHPKLKSGFLDEFRDRYKI